MMMDIEKLAYDHGANIYENGEVRFYTLSAFNKFAEAYHQAKCNEEIQTLRAKVASAEVLRVLLERAQNGLRWYQDEHPNDDSEADGELHIEIEQALATYDKLSEVKHDTNK